MVHDQLSGLLVLFPFREDPSGEDAEGGRNCSNRRREQGGSDRHAKLLGQASVFPLFVNHPRLALGAGLS